MSESTQRSRIAQGANIPGPREPSVPEVVVPPPAPPRSAWAGWVTFAGIAITLVGVVHAIEGIAALAQPDHYAVSQRGLLLHWSYTTWGWVHLVLGVVLIVAGVGVLNRNTVARVVGVAAAVLSAVSNLAFVSAAPIYALTVIALDVVFIYAICVHGGEVPVNRGNERVTGFTGPGATDHSPFAGA